MHLVLVEDHLALREGMSIVLTAHGHDVIGETDRVDGARALVRARHPDAVIIDLGLGGDDAIGLIAELARDPVRTRVIVHTGSEDGDEIRAALAAGAYAAVSKRASTTELLQALDAVAEGQPWLDPRLRSAAVSVAAAQPILTPREREVLTLLASGRSGAQAAEELFLSTETIRSHIKSAMKRLEANTRTQAVVLALQLAEITLDGGTAPEPAPRRYQRRSSPQ